MNAISIQTKSLLGLKDLSQQEIQSILDRAAYWEQHPSKTHELLKGKFIANMFLRTARELAHPSR